MSRVFDVTIIVPVFNREKIIKNTIKGINQQTINKNRMEVIFVDDKSTDKTVQSIHEAIDEDIAYKILERQVNSGCASVPRNNGLTIASGKYVFFIDSDDTIEPDLLERALDLALKNDSDIVYIKIKSDTGRAVAVRPYKQAIVDDASISKNHLFRSCAVFKLFKLAFLRANNLKFPMDIKVGEDKIFMTYALTKAKKISILADKAYINVYAHPGDHLSRNGNILDGFETRQKAIDYIATANIDPIKRKQSYNAWLILCIEALIRMSTARSKPYNFDYIFKKLAFSYSQCKEMLDLNEIYKEYQEFVYPLLYGDIQAFLDKAKEFKKKRSKQ